jgi:hypothetical protein
MDDYGVFRTYKEVLVNQHDPEQLAELIVKESVDPDGKMPRFEAFPFSHDAFAQRADGNTIAKRMSSFLMKASLPPPCNAGRDQVGREQMMYNMLRRRVPCGTLPNGMPRMVPNWVISSDCDRLIEQLGTAPRDKKKVEQIASYLGDDPLQGAGYGVYYVFGSPAEKPQSLQRQEMWARQPERSMHSRVMEQLRFDATHGQRKPMRGRTGWAR